MPPDEERVFTAIGGLQKQVTGLSDRFDRLITETMAEHRKVHDIVVATSESVRVLARDVAEMKPLTDDYRLKAAAIDKAVELTDDYKEEQAEKRGAEKFKNWIYGIVASVGGLIAIGVSKIIDRLLAPPHLPVVVAIALAITIVATAAFGAELPSACTRLRNAVTRYDVNVTIKPENVKRWNDVIRASRAMRKAAGCDS